MHSPGEVIDTKDVDALGKNVVSAAALHIKRSPNLADEIHCISNTKCKTTITQDFAEAANI